jgi:hypothetical protein
MLHAALQEADRCQDQDLMSSPRLTNSTPMQRGGGRRRCCSASLHSRRPAPEQPPLPSAPSAQAPATSREPRRLRFFAAALSPPRHDLLPCIAPGTARRSEGLVGGGVGFKRPRAHGLNARVRDQAAGALSFMHRYCIPRVLQDTELPPRPTSRSPGSIDSYPAAEASSLRAPRPGVHVVNSMERSVGGIEPGAMYDIRQGTNRLAQSRWMLTTSMPVTPLNLLAESARRTAALSLAPQRRCWCYESSGSVFNAFK